MKRPTVNIFGAVLLLIFAFLTLSAHFIAPFDLDERFAPYLRPSHIHRLGTDDMGSDIFSQLVHGTKVSLLVGLITAAAASILGMVIGLFAGYSRGLADGLLMGVTDIFLMIPRIPLLIVLTAFIKPGILTLSLLFGLLWWPAVARVIRSRVLQVREAGFIKSAECLGFGKGFIVFSEILPNIIPLIIPKFMMTFAAAIIAEASISFLGLGDPMVKSWGMMINLAFMNGGFINGMWWWYGAPGICITLLVAAMVLLGMSLEPHKRSLTETDGSDKQKF